MTRSLVIRDSREIARSEGAIWSEVAEAWLNTLDSAVFNACNKYLLCQASVSWLRASPPAPSPEVS